MTNHVTRSYIRAAKDMTFGHSDEQYEQWISILLQRAEKMIREYTEINEWNFLF
jgi:hypothetical protein